MGKRKNNLFWLSYSDLMTSLFFVMLVLFVVVFSIMQRKISILNVKAAEFDKINEIKKSLENLDAKYFKYDKENKRHELKVKIMFPPGNPEIPNNPQLRKELLAAGKTLANISKNIPNQNEDIKYLVIIEGMAARYNNPNERWKNKDAGYIDRTYILSYNRAKSLYNFWKVNGIKFDKDIFEIIIAGSGWFGSGRYTKSSEGKNKRFLIQIIPKVGEIESHE